MGTNKDIEPLEIPVQGVIQKEYPFIDDSLIPNVDRAHYVTYYA